VGEVSLDKGNQRIEKTEAGDSDSNSFLVEEERWGCSISTPSASHNVILRCNRGNVALNLAEKRELNRGKRRTPKSLTKMIRGPQASKYVKAHEWIVSTAERESEKK